MNNTFRVHPLIWLVLGSVLIFLGFIFYEGISIAISEVPMSAERSVVVFNRLVIAEGAFVVTWILAALGTIAHRSR